MIVFETNVAFAKKGDSKSKKNIELCCTWGHSLDDGILTFSVGNGGSDLAKIAKLSFKEWEKALDEEIQFKYIKDNSDADIDIEFKKVKEKKLEKL